MGDVVAPVLQELGRSPGVVDLVEVHLGRLAEAVDAHRKDHDNQSKHHPNVHPVETAARLRVEGRGAIGAVRRPRQPVPDGHHRTRNVYGLRRRVLAFVRLGLTDRGFVRGFAGG